MKSNSILETTGQDWANHLSHEISGNGCLFLIALLPCGLDMEALRQAAADLTQLQPVLGCRFDDSQDPPLWGPQEDAVQVAEMAAECFQEGLRQVTQTPSPLHARLIITLLTTPRQTALCLGFDHAATDAGGAKGCLALLSQCYNDRLAGRPIKTAAADRSEKQVFDGCGIPDYRMALKREAPAPGLIATLPFTSLEGGETAYRWLSLPLSHLRQPGATVNDRLLAAYAMAAANAQAEPVPVELHFTVDLRRYLEENAAPAAANLSGMETVRADIEPEASFHDVLEIIRTQTAQIKAGRPGLASAAMLCYMRAMPYHTARELLRLAGQKSRASGIAAPILSNFGLLAPENLAFGGAAVTDILPLPPAMRAPAFLLGAGSYSGMLTLSAGFYPRERAADSVERLLQTIRDILMDAAKK